MKDTQISIVAGIRSVKTHTITLAQFVHGVEMGEWRKRIEPIREAAARGAVKTVANLKADLDGILFSGRFSQRANVALEHHSGLICADIDKVGDGLSQLQERIGKGQHTVAVFVSPTGTGLKVVLRCDPNRPHIDAFRAAERYLVVTYGVKIDPACKDVARLCFVSWDPDLFVNYSAEALDYGQIAVGPLASEAASAPPAIVKVCPGAARTEREGDQVALVRRLLSFIPRRPAYPDWIRICSAVFSALPKDDGCALLDEWSPEEKKGEYAEKWRHRLDRITLGTLRFFAAQHGWQGAEEASVLRDATPVDQLEGDELVDWCAKNDQRGDAEMFASLGAGEFLFDHTANKWRIYRNGVWKMDETRKTRRRASKLIAARYFELARRRDNELAADLESGKLDAAASKNEPRTHMRDLLRKKGALLNKRKQIDDVLHLAGDFLAAVTVDFDLKPNLLNLLNGTYDFGADEFREHNWTDMLSHQAQIEYQSGATCPRWEEFITTICCDDAELAAFVQRALACSVAGEVSLNAVLLCYGRGRNGKTTFFKVLQHLLGDYFAPLSIEALLTQGRSGRDSIAMAEMVKLRGARLAWASEIPEGRQLNEAQLKDLSGGDVVIARSLYQNPVQFMPSHTLWMAGNHQPEIHGTDEGIWRRIYMIPFRHQFPKSGEPGHREFDAVVAELQAEAPGILNWLIAGARDLRTSGLNPPPTVLTATDGYRKDSDVLNDFIEVCCVAEAGATVVTRELWSAYTNHCDGEKPSFTRRTFAFALQRRGFQLGRTSAARTIMGLRLKRPEDTCDT